MNQSELLRDAKTTLGLRRRQKGMWQSTVSYLYAPWPLLLSGRSIVGLEEEVKGLDKAIGMMRVPEQAWK